MPERERKRNMVALTAQLKIKGCLKCGEFVRVACAHFFFFFFFKQVYLPNIKSLQVEKGKVQKMQSNENVTFIGSDTIR